MNNSVFQALICLLIFYNAAAQNEKPVKNLSIYFTAEKKYLVLPVKNGAAKRFLELWVDGINTRFWDMELAEEKPDWYAYMQIDQWKGKPIELRVDKVAKDSKVFMPVIQSHLDTNANTYHESMRAQFHFSPKRGWTNDPNGMVYYKGEYHLFYQHNPYGRMWGNMTWGHVVSKDLVHWTELDDAIHPDGFGPVFSGSAIVDSTNTSKLGKDGNMPMILFHTGAKSWAQCLSWTNDGRTFEGIAERAVITRINKDNRDPKVIWHEPTKKWVIVVYVERGDNEQHSMQFLSSPDLKNWTPTSVIMGGIHDDRYLFECPEFYELALDGNPAEKKWILTGANTEYAIGTFDGKTFVPEQQKLQQQYGRDFYAPQTFNNEPNGRRIEIGWWRTHTAKGDMTFNQSMSIPMEHRLVRTSEGPRLIRMPVKELEQLRSLSFIIGSATVKENGNNPLKDINLELAELNLEFNPGRASELILNIRGVAITYNKGKSELAVDGVHAPVALINGKLKLRIFVDRTGIELFANDGLMFMPVNINIEAGNRAFSLSSKGGTVKVTGLTVYELKSIW